jgi:hypothetical protein
MFLECQFLSPKRMQYVLSLPLLYTDRQEKLTWTNYAVVDISSDLHYHDASNSI